jgi:gamma-glutamyltranspeptidase
MLALEKQMVSGSRGVVTANHPVGAAAGLEMLAQNGGILTIWSRI